MVALIKGLIISAIIVGIGFVAFTVGILAIVLS